VICNAPLCITAAAAWQILETAKYTRRKLWVAGNSCRLWEGLRNEAGTITRLHAWARSDRSEKGTLFPDGGLLYTQFDGLAAALAILVGPLDTVTGSLDGGDGTEALENTGHAELQFGEAQTGFFDWTSAAFAEQLTPGFSIQLEGTNGSVTITGTFAEDGTLQLNPFHAQGFPLTDPGPGAPVQELVARAIRREAIPEWDAFSALRVVEFIDRIYARIRK
jgi:UDP-N-acetyl-2-amino-2-deoxyglucuronate dehydrogenase